MKRAMRVKAITTRLVALTVTLSLLALSGCSGVTGSKEIELTPVITAPAIGVDGVLRVGVDSTNAPYAGTSDGNIVGVDADIAAALAEEMGLTLELVDTKGQNADSVLSSGTVDVIMDREQSGSSSVSGTLVGPYLESGPALFAVVRSNTAPAEVNTASLAGTKIAAQKDSLSAWTLEEIIGAGTADPRESLDLAFKALEQGEVGYAAADAVVGSYLALEYKDISCVKLLGTPIGVYMGVSSEKTELIGALTEALRSLRDKGVLETLLAKWLGPVSAQVIMGETGITSSASSGSGAAAGGTVDTGEDLPDPSNAG